ncbi:MAG TPA: hypothetical protein VFZ53_08600 [Polyangiaceae bacterium]
MKTSSSRRARRAARTLGAILFAAALPACTVELTDDGAGVESSETRATEARILADIVFDGGQHVQFIETAKGSVSLSEVGPGDPNEAILKRMRPGSLLDVYSTLLEHGAAYDAAVVERLTEAELRVDAQAAERAAVATRSAVPPRLESNLESDARSDGQNTGSLGRHSEALSIDEQGSHPAFTDQEFEDVYCNSEDGYDQEFCAIRSTSASTGWSDDTAWIRSLVLNIARSGSTTHNLRQYVCTQSIPLFGCVAYGWRTTHSQSIPRLNYGIFVSDFPFTAFTANGSLFHLGEVADFL